MARYENYRLGHKLGDGRFAEVYEALDRRTGAKVALKRVKLDLMRPDKVDAVARLSHEIDVQTHVAHPNIMPILDSDPEFSWYTMPVAARILRDQATPFADQMLFEVVEHCAQGLAAAHQTDNIHRDVSPNNIMQLHEDGVTRWVVADWGLVRQHGRTTVVRTVPHGTFGTEGFAAPELWHSPHDADSRADVYGLGRVVGWTLTGTWPIPNLPIKNIPPRWTRFVEETTALEIEERARDMDVVLALLQQTRQWTEEDEPAPKGRVESFAPYLKRIIQYLWNNGAPREATRAELTEAVGPGAYGNNSKLIYIWNLVEAGEQKGTRRLTEQGRLFAQGQLSIHRKMVQDANSEEWGPVGGSQPVYITDLSD